MTECDNIEDITAKRMYKYFMNFSSVPMSKICTIVPNDSLELANYIYAANYLDKYFMVEANALVHLSKKSTLVKIKVFQERYVKFLIEYLSIGEYLFSDIKTAIETMKFPILQGYRYHADQIRSLLEQSTSLEAAVYLIGDDCDLNTSQSNEETDEETAEETDEETAEEQEEPIERTEQDEQSA